VLIKAALFVLTLVVTTAVGAPSHAQSTTREWMAKDSKRPPLRRYEGNTSATSASDTPPREAKIKQKSDGTGPIDSDNSGGPQLIPDSGGRRQ
jgi:hypothetical protein